MSKQPELELTPQPELPLSESPPPGLPRVWYLVTNQLNLMFQLAGGLMTGPRGFGHKYYRDPLGEAPGWIPLFAEPIPAGAMEQATSEENYLQCVIAAIDLSALTGPIQALDRQGRMVALQWPAEARGDEQVLFLRAPLPTLWMQEILFPTAQGRDAFRQQGADYSNVLIQDVKQRVRSRLFSSRAAQPWPPEILALPACDQSLHRVSAMGAFQALVLWFANRGDGLVNLGQRMADSSETMGTGADNPLARTLLSWVQGHDEPQEDEVQSRMLTRLLGAIINAKAASDPPATAGCGPDMHQAVLDALDAEKAHIGEPRWQEALARLIDDLTGLLGLGNATISELLKRHSRPLSRALILYFLREHSEELVALAAHQPLLTEQDLIVAAALFGARDGWMGLPQRMKETPGLAAATTWRMAARAHSTQGSGLDLGPAPPRVRALRELIQPRTSHQNKRQQEAALRLARAMGWQDVLKTRISLGKGDYRLQIDGRGAHLLIHGDVKAVATEVDLHLLFEQLVQLPPPIKIEAEIRSLLGE